MRNLGWSESIAKDGILGTPTDNGLEERILKEGPGQESHGAKDLSSAMLARCLVKFGIWKSVNGKTLHCGYYSR